MDCFNPIEVYFHIGPDGLYTGSPQFYIPLFESIQDQKDWQNYYTEKALISCGSCPFCIARKRASVDIRLKAELYKCKEPSSFITLTYDNQSLPYFGGLNYPDIAIFIASVRHWLNRNRPGCSFKWVRSGEYGDLTRRPHYHLIFFGLDVLDIKDFGPNKVVNGYYSSSFISNFWRFGYNCTCRASAKCCSYTCGYTVKKLSINSSECLNELRQKDAWTRKRKMDFLTYYNIRLKDEKSLDRKNFSELMQKYNKFKYLKGVYFDAKNRLRERKMINYNYPVSSCLKIGDLYYPAENIRVSKHIGLEYFKENLDFLKFGYVMDPFDSRVKRSLPISYVNWLKNTNEESYVLYKKKRLEFAGYSHIEDKQQIYKKYEKTIDNFRYTDRPLDRDNCLNFTSAPLDEEEIMEFEVV